MVYGANENKRIAFSVAIQNDGIHCGFAKDREFKHLVKWDGRNSKLQPSYGGVASVAVQGPHMVVVARSGVVLYKDLSAYSDSC